MYYPSIFIYTHTKDVAVNQWIKACRCGQEVQIVFQIKHSEKLLPSLSQNQQGYHITKLQYLFCNIYWEMLKHFSTVQTVGIEPIHIDISIV